MKLYLLNKLKFSGTKKLNKIYFNINLLFKNFDYLKRKEIRVGYPE